MPDVIITADTVSTLSENLGSDADAIFFVSRTASLINTITTAATGDGRDQIFQVDGTLIADGTGISAAGLDQQIVVTGSATADLAGISSTGNEVSIHITGTLSAGSNGITASGSRAEITIGQTGSVFGNDFGMRIGGVSGGVNPAYSSLTNAGLISGVDNAIGITTTAFINNSGVVSQTGNGTFGDGNAAITF